jgi:hypothetical protein
MLQRIISRYSKNYYNLAFPEFSPHPSILTRLFHRLFDPGSFSPVGLTAAMEPRLLRLPRVDSSAEENSFVLVHVSSQGTKPFDLKLIGTDNATAFAVSCKGAI